MKPEPIEEYSEFITHKGMDIKILGEVFDEPIRKTSDIDIHTQVSCIDTQTGIVIYQSGDPLRYSYPKKNDLETLKLLVKEVKDKINILYP